MLDILKKQYKEHLEVVKNNFDLPEKIHHFFLIVAEAFKKKNRLYACGNGGSSCDAMHLVEEMVGRYKNDRPPMAAHHLMDPSIMTCWSNDKSYEDVFRRQIEAYGREGDIFVGISTSGNSLNVFTALKQAKTQGLKTISLLGKDGGKIKGLADLDIIINSNTTARIQEMHIFVIHSLLEALDKELYGV